MGCGVCGCGEEVSEAFGVDMPDAGSQTELGLKSQFPLVTFRNVNEINFILILFLISTFISNDVSV